MSQHKQQYSKNLSERVFPDPEAPDLPMSQATSLGYHLKKTVLLMNPENENMIERLYEIPNLYPPINKL